MDTNSQPIEQLLNDLEDQKLPKLDPSTSSKPKRPSFLKKYRTPLIIIIALLVILISTLIFFLTNRQSASEQQAHIDQQTPPPPAKIYSLISGEEITDSNLNQKPTYCVQIPNGLDGARPQVGLHEAKVVFEAIAEAGITRFAAVFQDPKGSVIGPIRSLRTYYLDWDTSFNCTLVHAGGSYEAIQEARKYRDLTESATFMWRGNGYWAGRNFVGYYPPNNLFTSANLLQQFNQKHNYHTSTVNGFARMKPEEAVENLTAIKEDTTQTFALAKNIQIKFGHAPSFNPTYTYQPETNRYLRAYADGSPHLSHSCAPELNRPAPQKDCGTAAQLQPQVVIVMKVDEWLDSDHYHHVIKTISSGEATIFQNGIVLSATWKKTNREAQIEFFDQNQNPIKLVPGQVWVSAIPKDGGSLSYQP